jgi:transcriptional regulator with PAS, ATPase and Fis domain
MSQIQAHSPGFKQLCDSIASFPRLPGNVRELRRAIERGMILEESKLALGRGTWARQIPHCQVHILHFRFSEIRPNPSRLNHASAKETC